MARRGVPSADTYNPYLGKAAAADCLTCTDPSFTSLPGSDYCLAPSTDCPAGEAIGGSASEASAPGPSMPF